MNSMSLFEPTAVWTDALRAEVHRGIRLLAGRCDGARTLDGQGFSGIDARVGHALASMPLSLLDDDTLLGAYGMLRRYRRQLVKLGLDLDAIPVPPGFGVVRRPDLPNAVFLEDADTIVVQFRYKPEWVLEVKRLTGARFRSSDKTWTLPASSAGEAAEFAQRLGFACDLAVPEGEVRRVASGSVTLLGGELLLRFAYDPMTSELVRRLPNRRFDRALKGWCVPTYLIRSVRRLAERANWELSDEVAALPDADPSRPPMTIVEEAGELVVRFPFTGELRLMMKSIEDARWDAGHSCWHVPLHRAASLHERLQVFYADKLTEQIQVELLDGSSLDGLVQRLVLRERLSKAIEPSEGFVVNGEYGMTPKPHQVAGMEYLEASRMPNGRIAAFIGDPVGQGKTGSALMAAEHFDAWPMVVVAKNGLKLNWLTEIRTWMPERVVSMAEGTRARALSGGMLDDPDIVIISYDVVRHWRQAIRDLKPRSLVLDESQMVKDPSTQRTKSLIDIGRAVPDDGMVLMLSATPSENHRIEFASQLEIMGRLEEFGGRVNVKRMYDLNDRLRSAGAYLRRSKSEILKGLPPPQHTPVLISELDEQAMTEYRTAEKDLIKYLADRAAEQAAEMGLDPSSARMAEVIRVGAMQHLMAVGVLKTLAARAKLPYVDTWIEDFLETGDKLLMYAHHLEIVDHVAKRFKCPTIQGRISLAQRESIKIAFQTESDPQMISMNLATGAEGLTLTAASDTGLIEFPWTSTKCDQILGRTYGRTNDPHGATLYYFTAAGTIDERIIRLLDEKRRETDHANEGIEPDDDSERSTSILGDLLVELTYEGLGYDLPSGLDDA